MRNRILISVAAAAIAFAGCGGDDDEPTTAESATAALTEEEFVTQANEICATGAAEIDQAAEELFGNEQPTDEQVEQFATDVVVPGIEAQIDGVEALVPPEDIAGQVDTFIADARAALAEVAADPSLILAGDTPEDPFADVNAQAEALGLPECAD